ncbi:MAG: hypothetical protein IT448_06115 [Phycisphaerales bacterium]|nr:hypothetical protein [Phycisphaerales bacterium]
MRQKVHWHQLIREDSLLADGRKQIATQTMYHARFFPNTPLEIFSRMMNYDTNSGSVKRTTRRLIHNLAIGLLISTK